MMKLSTAMKLVVEPMKHARSSDPDAARLARLDDDGFDAIVAELKALRKVRRWSQGHARAMRRVQGRTFTAGERAVLEAIIDRCGKNGRCWPSIEQMAQDTGYTPDHVKHCIRELRRKTLILRRRCRSRYGNWTNNEYTVPAMLDGWAPLPCGKETT